MAEACRCWSNARLQTTSVYRVRLLCALLARPGPGSVHERSCVLTTRDLTITSPRLWLPSRLNPTRRRHAVEEPGDPRALFHAESTPGVHPGPGGRGSRDPFAVPMNQFRRTLQRHPRSVCAGWHEAPGGPRALSCDEQRLAFWPRPACSRLGSDEPSSDAMCAQHLTI